MKKNCQELIDKYFMKQGIWWLLGISLLVRLLFAFRWHEIWWDSGVYLGMGKWLWSLGSAGLWEDIRPVLWPVVLGFFWKLSISPVLAARAIMLVLSIGCMWLVFKICKKISDERTALLATGLFGFSQIFFFLGFHEYTEIPSLFFVLLSVLLFLNESLFWAGLSLGLATLTRFPSGIFGIALLCMLCWQNSWKHIWQQCCKLGAGFGVVVAPFLVWSTWMYSNPLHSFIEGQRVIGKVLGCTVLHARPWYAYFQLLWFEHWVYAFAVIGFTLFLVKPSRTRMVVVLCTLFPLAYYSLLPCRDYRYLLSFLPFVTLLACEGVQWFFNKSWCCKKAWLWHVVCFVLLGVAVFHAITFYQGEYVAKDDISEAYLQFFANVDASGEVWIANPVMAVYSDLLLHKVYYPVYDGTIAKSFHEYLVQHTNNIEYVALDNCGGGIICADADMHCAQELNDTRAFLSEHFVPVLNASRRRCWHLIFRNNAYQ